LPHELVLEESLKISIVLNFHTHTPSFFIYKTNDLVNMVTSTLSKVSKDPKASKAIIKMDPSMLPETFRNLLTSFKLNAKNLERCSQKCKNEGSLLKTVAEVSS
jgi:hypothetical protein